jgi:hypothetical protein
MLPCMAICGYAPYFPLGYRWVTSSLKINTQFITS